MDLLLIMLNAISPKFCMHITTFVRTLPNFVKNSDNPLDKLFANFLLNLFDIRD
ncbi:hypothetical protein ES703_11892 [subsurface metagenome]